MRQDLEHIETCLSLETGQAKDCRCADEEKHYWGLAKLSLLGFVIQGLMNFQADSVALFADMVHQLLDGGENTTSAVVARKARSSQDEKKLRKIGGFISATLIFGASLWILHETLDRLSSLKEISPWWMLAGGFAGLAVGVRQFVKHANAHEEHKNETHWWQYWHLVSDIAGSIAVVAGAVSHMSGYMFGDTAASLFVVGIIWVRVTLKLYNDFNGKPKHSASHDHPH